MTLVTKAFFTRVHLIVLTLFGLLGCQSIQDRNDSVVEISASSSIPPVYEPAKERLEKIEEIVLPENAILISRVTRPKANMRSGPGTQFDLIDKSLSRTDSVYLFERVGVWQKVSESKTAKEGWLHYQTIMTPWLNPTKITLKTKNLPKAFASKNISHVYTFPDKQKTEFKIPKGAMFNAIAVSEFGTLIWLHQNNSVMWIAGKALK